MSKAEEGDGNSINYSDVIHLSYFFPVFFSVMFKLPLFLTELPYCSPLLSSFLTAIVSSLFLSLLYLLFSLHTSHMYTSLSSHLGLSATSTAWVCPFLFPPPTECQPLLIQLLKSFHSHHTQPGNSPSDLKEEVHGPPEASPTSNRSFALG